MKRHMQTVHRDPHIDCEYRKCDRRGDYGFRRMDHYREHLRGYHNQKSESAAKRRAHSHGGDCDGVGANFKDNRR